MIQHNRHFQVLIIMPQREKQHFGSYTTSLDLRMPLDRETRTLYWPECPLYWPKRLYWKQNRFIYKLKSPKDVGLHLWTFWLTFIPNALFYSRRRMQSSESISSSRTWEMCILWYSQINLIVLMNIQNDVGLTWLV